ncbi:MAG TPA: neutral zinc metallopeptidase, partial [Candidatus Kapabacteria bacterium]|nr:neutral zinc metallopeptidase [Candidatus Kapabacteria bacterium]
MQWRGRAGSGNIVDRRGGGGGMIGGGIGALVLGLLAYFLGVDPESLPPEVTGGGQAQEQQIPAND